MEPRGHFGRAHRAHRRRIGRLERRIADARGIVRVAVRRVLGAGRLFLVLRRDAGARTAAAAGERVAAVVARGGAEHRDREKGEDGLLHDLLRTS